MHVLAATDTWNNVSRWIPRKLMAEFEMRVLFQMSANDSANLIDSPAATSLGLHRALFHNEHYGTLETFRPYAMPDDGWLDEIARTPANRRCVATHFHGRRAFSLLEMERQGDFSVLVLVEASDGSKSKSP